MWKLGFYEIISRLFQSVYEGKLLSWCVSWKCSLEVSLVSSINCRILLHRWRTKQSHGDSKSSDVVKIYWVGSFKWWEVGTFTSCKMQEIWHDVKVEQSWCLTISYFNLFIVVAIYRLWSWLGHFAISHLRIRLIKMCCIWF